MRHLSIMSPAHVAEVNIISLWFTSFKLVFPSCFLSFSEESAPFAPSQWAELDSPDTITPVPQSRCQPGPGRVLENPFIGGLLLLHASSCLYLLPRGGSGCPG